MDTGEIYLDNQIDSKINRQMDTGVIYLDIFRQFKIDRQMEGYIQIIRQTVQDK